MIPAAEWDVALHRRLASPDAASRRKLAAWLRVDYDAIGGYFAMMPFERIDTDDGPAVAAALKPPMVFFDDAEVERQHDDARLLHLIRAFGDPESEQVAWAATQPARYRFTGPADRQGKCATDSPVLLVDRGQMHRERGSHLVIADPDYLAMSKVEAMTLYTDTVTWARDWARNRQLFVHRRIASARDYLIELNEPGDGLYPGALLIGDASRVQWPQGITFACPDDATVKAVTRAIHRRANLARAVVASPMRIAA